MVFPGLPRELTLEGLCEALERKEPGSLSHLKRVAVFAIALAQAMKLASVGSEEGLGRAHMDISCSPPVAAKFDRAFALLHNFWYGRALEGFQQVANDDPECAMAYWGAAMTYNHPFWDAPSSADETAAWGLVQKGFAV